jgi:hypothetical protein
MYKQLNTSSTISPVNIQGSGPTILLITPIDIAVNPQIKPDTFIQL